MDHPTRVPPRTTASRDATASLVAAPPRSVAVFRALQLGDMLCAVPALRALRAALPHSEITLVGLPWAQDFARRFRRYIDTFLEFPGYPGLPERVPDLDALPAFLVEARSRRFDLVLQMHGSGEITNPLAALLGGRALAGFYRPGQYCPDPARFIVYPDGERELRRSLALVPHLGIGPRGEYLEFPIEEAERDEARQLLGRPLGASAYACLHAGARAPERRWAPEAFAEVGRALAARGLRVVLTGSREERSLTQIVAASMSGGTAGADVLDLAGRTSLGAMAAIIGGARVLVCNDTGVSHIADALRVPSVVIFTGSDPARWAPLDSTTHRVVRASDAASRGGRQSAIRRAVAEVDELLRDPHVTRLPRSEAPHAA